MPKNVMIGHSCSLPTEKRDDVVTISPYSNFFTKLCFGLKRYLLVSKYYESRQYFRSNASFAKEKNRQLGTPEYRNVIHPFSLFARRQRILMCFMWLFQFYVPPYLVSFMAKSILAENKKLSIIDILMLIMQVILVVDIICRFFVGYVVKESQEVVLEPRKIAQHYLRTYFWFDAVPTVACIVLFFFKHTDIKYRIVIHQIYLMRIARLKSVMSNLYMMYKAVGINDSIITCLLLTLLGFLIVHWWTCTLGFISTVRDIYNIPNNESWHVKMVADEERILLSTGESSDGSTVMRAFADYNQYAAIVMCHFFGAGVGPYKTKDSLEMLIFACIVVNGMMFYIYILARMLQLFGMVNFSGSKYDEIVAQAAEYMIVKKFPSSLKNRINNYYDYKFNKTFFSETEILDSLSEHLRMEILLYSCRNLLERVPVFRGLSRSASGCILSLLKQEIFLPQDVVMSPHQQNTALYFILYGTCSVSLPSGSEVMHVFDGDQFGDTCGYTTANTKEIPYTFKALESCEIYSLQKADIEYCCHTYPEIIPKLEAIAKEIVKDYNSILESAEFNIGDANDIIDELRRGHILHNERRSFIF